MARYSTTQQRSRRFDTADRTTWSKMGTECVYSFLLSPPSSSCGSLPSPPPCGPALQLWKSAHPHSGTWTSPPSFLLETASQPTFLLETIYPQTFLIYKTTQIPEADNQHMCKAANRECREACPLGQEKARTMKVANSRNLKREIRQLVKWQSWSFEKCHPLRTLEMRKLTSCILRILRMRKNADNRNRDVCMYVL